MTRTPIEGAPGWFIATYDDCCGEPPTLGREGSDVSACIFPADRVSDISQAVDWYPRRPDYDVPSAAIHALWAAHEAWEKARQG